MRECCPQGIDVYFDNVGGPLLDVVLMHINRAARIVFCGAISMYNTTSAVEGPRNYLSLLVNRARMEGMIVFDYVHRYPEAIVQMVQWMREGRLSGREHIVDGLEAFPETLLKLFSGDHFGKLVIRVKD